MAEQSEYYLRDLLAEAKDIRRLLESIKDKLREVERIKKNNRQKKIGLNLSSFYFINQFLNN